MPSQSRRTAAAMKNYAARKNRRLDDIAHGSRPPDLGVIGREPSTATHQPKAIDPAIRRLIDEAIEKRGR